MITIRKKRIDGFSAQYQIREHDRLLAVCGGDQLDPRGPSQGEAAQHSARLAAAFRGEPLPAGWTVEKRAAGFLVRDERQRIVAWRQWHQTRSDQMTAEQCAGLADRLSSQSGSDVVVAEEAEE